VLSNFLLPVGQSVTSALLIVATLIVAWTASRDVLRPSDGTEITTVD
jgi:hypothetical protein